MKNISIETMTAGSKQSDLEMSPARDEAAQQIPIAGNRLDSSDLFRSARELIIAHGEETYRLRLTSQNKLILTK